MKEIFYVLKMLVAYCFSMCSNYNSRYKPAEVLYNGFDSKLIRRRETFKDLINTQIIN